MYLQASPDAPVIGQCILCTEGTKVQPKGFPGRHGIQARDLSCLILVATVTWL